ncbi:hypothetical protein [Phenylobacterium sp.]|uniref:hypothetical protein n=1 Tax=Phenylobacterium sp. TaxID=1871053 RepID=UPI0035AF265F
MTSPNPQEGGKHTPVPWTFEKCRCGHPSCKQFTLSNQGSVGFSEDDARLIAAAPALLEALKAVSEMLMVRPDIVAKLHPLMGFAEKETFEKASAALLQATGGENGR